MTDQNDMREALLPCPFCCGSNLYAERKDLSETVIVCNDCGVFGPGGCPENDGDLNLEEENDLHPGELMARRRWNDRQSLQAQGADLVGPLPDAPKGRFLRYPSPPKPAVPAGWQPMDTAPKDGTEIIIKVERRAGVKGCCLVGHYMTGGHCIEDHPPIDAGWYFWNGYMFDRAAKPIGWQKLPGSEDYADWLAAAPAARELIKAIKIVQLSRHQREIINGTPCFWHPIEWLHYIQKLAGDLESSLQPDTKTNESECLTQKNKQLRGALTAAKEVLDIAADHGLYQIGSIGHAEINHCAQMIREALEESGGPKCF